MTESAGLVSIRTTRQDFLARVNEMKRIVLLLFFLASTLQGQTYRLATDVGCGNDSLGTPGVCHVGNLVGTIESDGTTHVREIDTGKMLYRMPGSKSQTPWVAMNGTESCAINGNQVFAYRGSEPRVVCLLPDLQEPGEAGHKWQFQATSDNLYSVGDQLWVGRINWWPSNSKLPPKYHVAMLQIAAPNWRVVEVHSVQDLTNEQNAWRGGYWHDCYSGRDAGGQGILRMIHEREWLPWFSRASYQKVWHQWIGTADQEPTIIERLNHPVWRVIGGETVRVNTTWINGLGAVEFDSGRPPIIWDRTTVPNHLHLDPQGWLICSLDVRNEENLWDQSRVEVWSPDNKLVESWPCPLEKRGVDYAFHDLARPFFSIGSERSWFGYHQKDGPQLYLVLHQREGVVPPLPPNDHEQRISDLELIVKRLELKVDQNASEIEKHRSALLESSETLVEGIK